MAEDLNSSHEREYLRQRMSVIVERLAQTDVKFVHVGAGKVDLADENDDAETEHTRRLKRELRLLQHLQRRAQEGQALKAAEDWRRSLGVRLREHRQQYRAEQDAYDAWWQLPPYQRARIPQPPKPPELWIRDRYGERWLINDRFMLVLDNIIANLKKWRDTA